MAFADSKDIHNKVELARLETNLRAAWQDDLRLHGTRFAAELSLATTQIMAWIAVVVTLMAVFVLLLLTPRRATPRPAPVSVASAMDTAGTPTPLVPESDGVLRSVRAEYPRLVVAAPGIAEVRSLERRLIGWVFVFWGTGIFALAGATLAMVKL